jgi:hypothetical protein
LLNGRWRATSIELELFPGRTELELQAVTNKNIDKQANNLMGSRFMAFS